MATDYRNTLRYDKQIEFTGVGYLDTKAMPVNTKAELDNLNLATGAFEGMEVIVLEDETYNSMRTKYKFVNEEWVLVDPSIITGDDVE